MTRVRQLDPRAFLSVAKPRSEFALDVEELRRRLEYSPETGEFRWLISPARGTKRGSIAGTISGPGYRLISLNYQKLWAHRLAFVFMTGQWPDGEVDHVNGVKLDNRASNLRVVSRDLNIQNARRAHADSSTGVLGVCRDAARNKFLAQIGLGGRHYFLGRFETVDAAHSAYLEAKRKLHEGCTL